MSQIPPRVLGGRIEERLTRLIGEVTEEKGAWLVEVEFISDHVRLLIEVDSQFGIHKLVKAIKGRSCRVLRQKFPHVKSTLGTNSCFVAGVGGAPLDVVTRYVENRKNR